MQLLKNQIKEGCLDRLYFFYGEEQFLMHHYLEQIRKLLLDPLTESFNFHKLTAEQFNLRVFADALENLPMMAEFSLIVVDEVNPFTLEESDREQIAQLFSDIPDYCTVIFTYETTPWAPDGRKKKLTAAIEEHATVVCFPLQETRDLISWITRHFRSVGKKITPELCAYLVEITGGSMTTLAGEIAKISAYSGAEHICRSDIDAVVEPVVDAVVYQMTDAIGSGRYTDALVKLRMLFKMQQEPLGILGWMGSYFRQISAARTLRDQGKGEPELKKFYPQLQGYGLRKAMEASRNFKPDFLRKAASLIMETDYRLKSSREDPQRMLELVIVQLAMEASHD